MGETAGDGGHGRRRNGIPPAGGPTLRLRGAGGGAPAEEPGHASGGAPGETAGDGRWQETGRETAGETGREVAQRVWALVLLHGGEALRGLGCVRRWLEVR